MPANASPLFRSSIVPCFESDDYAITETFHEFTKLNVDNVAAIGKRAALAKADPRLRATVSRSWKTYRGHPEVNLPAPHLPAISLEDALRARKSLSSTPGAEFSRAAMTLEQLSGVLGMSYGVSRAKPDDPEDAHRFRMTPSAGGLYPLEVYPLVFRVDGLAEGVYHYSVPNHSLELVRPGECHADFTAASSYPDLCRNAAVALVVTGMFQRNLWKYLNRGYRFVMNDAGALIQSFYLTGTAFNLGTCAVGGFLDDEMGTLLGVNNVDEVPVICFLLGPAKGA